MSSAQVAVAAAVAAFTGLAFMNWRDKVNGKQLEKKKYEVRAFRQHQRPGAEGSEPEGVFLRLSGTRSRRAERRAKVAQHARCRA